MAFPADPLNVTVEVALDVDVTQDPVFWFWTDVTPYVRTRSLLTITQGRGDRASTVQPATCRMTVDNTGGRWVARNPVGPWYRQIRRGTPIRVLVDGSVRFAGYIDELPVRWDKSGNDKYVDLAASGILQRLGRGLAPARSSAYRAFTSPDYAQPVAYWPMEDEDGAASIASAIPGAEPMSIIDVDLASDSSFAGSKPLPQIAPTGRISWFVPAYTHTGEWRVRWLFRLDAAPPGDSDLMGWYCPGATIPHWVLRLTTGGVMTLRGYNASFTEVLGDAGVNVSALLGSVTVSVQAVQNGADVDWAWTLYGLPGFYASSGTETGATIAAITSGGLQNGTNLGEIVIGHVAIYDDVDAAPDSVAAFGWPDQTAVNAIFGIASDARIPMVTNEGPAGSVSLLGPQPFGDDLFMMRDAELADGGVLYEDAFGLVYLARYERFNRDVDLALDQGLRHITDLQPVDDGQDVVNECEVRRSGGSSATAMDSAHIRRHGRAATSLTININSDLDLAARAQWEVHLGTTDELRVPHLSLNLARTPDLIADWLTCHVGSRITVSNPFPELPPDDLDLHLEGWTEILGPFTWDVIANLSPAGPWQVFEVEGTGNSGRVDTGGTVLNAPVDDNDTAMQLAVTGEVLWSTTAEPYDLGVGGERVTADPMTSETPVFVAAGAAAHGANGADLAPALPAGVQAGDLLLVFAAIRDPTATVLAVPGYQDLGIVGGPNVGIFARTHSGTETAPDVIFDSGGANDDTTAQVAAFRYTQPVVVTSATQANVSAQNIAYPALVPTRDRCVVLYLGWKADDWTSVTSPGTEIGEPDTTTGDDQGIVWSYQIQTTAAPIAAGSFTVSGGASAISGATVLALRSDVMTATVTRSVNGVTKSHDVGAEVSLWRPNVIAQ